MRGQGCYWPPCLAQFSWLKVMWSPHANSDLVDAFNVAVNEVDEWLENNLDNRIKDLGHCDCVC